MDAATFWALIDATRTAADGDAKKQAVLLTDELAKLPGEEIISFHNIFNDLKGNAYRGNLWDAAFIIMYYCSDSGFQEFREWLIGRGKVAYEKAISNPETLVDVLEIGEQVFPTLLSPAFDAYERVTGNEMPPTPGIPAPLQESPTGDHHIDEILGRFPKLTARFWEWWTRDRMYLEIRELLRENLFPLGFVEDDAMSSGTIAFRRTPLVVALVLDYYVPDYTVYVSKIAGKRLFPADTLIHLLPQEYNEDLKTVISTRLQQWLETTAT